MSVGVDEEKVNKVCLEMMRNGVDGNNTLILRKMLLILYRLDIEMGEMDVRGR